MRRRIFRDILSRTKSHNNDKLHYHRKKHPYSYFPWQKDHVLYRQNQLSYIGACIMGVFLLSMQDFGDARRNQSLFTGCEGDNDEGEDDVEGYKEDWSDLGPDKETDCTLCMGFRQGPCGNRWRRQEVS